MDKQMAELKKLISSLLISCPLQMTVFKLDRDYADEIGERIPFRKFGFNSLEECLRSMPDVLELRGSGLYAEVFVRVSNKAAHIDKLISNQKIVAPKRPHFGSRLKQRRPSAVRRHTTHPVPMNQFMRPLPPPLRPLPPPLRPLPPPLMPYHLFPSNYNEPSRFYRPPKSLIPIPACYPSPPNQVQKCSKYSLPQSHSTPKFHNELISSGQTMQQTSDKNLKQKEATPSSSKDSAQLPKSTVSDVSNAYGAIPKQKDLHLPPPSPSEISEYEEEEIYMSDTDNENEYEAYIPGIMDGHHKNVENICSTATVDIFQSEPEKSQANTSCNFYNNVPLSVQKNLKTLISKSNDGIWCATLPNIYKKMFGKELDFMEYKYKSLITMCMDLNDIFCCIRPDNGDFKLYDKQKPLPKDYDKNFKVSEFVKANQIFMHQPSREPAVIDVEEIVQREGLSTYPLDVLKINDDIPRQFLPEGVAHEDEFIDVCVGEVYDPSKFWILINEYSDQLNSLMDDMQIFYDSCDNNLEIPENMLRIGLFCAATYNQEYHRAIIVSEVNSKTGKIKIFYVDYGTVATISSKGIYYLHRRFSTLPQQAIRARLASIYPPTEKTPWSPEASSRLLSLVSMKILVAHIYRIDWERRTLEIFLVDTTSSEDIYMNDALVNEGFAVFCHEEQQNPQKELKAIPKVKHIHLFPTFSEIEQGLTPSASELLRLTKLGVTIDRLYPHYFEYNFNTNEIDAIILNEDQNLKELQERVRIMMESPCFRINNDYDEFIIKNEKELEKKEKSMAANTRTRLINNCPDETSPSWPELCDEDSTVESIDRCSSGLSELSSCISKTSVSPEAICAKPIVKPPPGFDKIKITTTTQQVSVDNIQGTRVTQTTNLGGGNPNPLLLNYLLTQQQNVLNSNILPQQNLIPQPLTIPTVVNQPVSYLPIAQQLLLLPNQAAIINQPFAIQNQFQQQLSHINYLQSAAQLLQQQSLQAQAWQNMQTQSNMQSQYLNLLQNTYFQQQNLGKSDTIIQNNSVSKERSILQQVIGQHLANGNTNLLNYFQQILRRQQTTSVDSNRDLFALLSSIIANKPLGISNIYMKDVFNKLLNTLKDHEIVELAQKITELPIATSENNITTEPENKAQINTTYSDVGTNPESPSHQQMNDGNCETEDIPNLDEISIKSSTSSFTKIDKKNKKNKARKLVIRTDLNKKPIHVIRIRNKAYVIVNEIMQLTIQKAPIEKVRKLMVMVDPSNPIVDVSLNDHKEVAQELSRYREFDKNSTLHMIPIAFIPKIIEILGSRDTKTDYHGFLKKMDTTNKIWLKT